MNGQRMNYKKYYEYVKKMSAPVMPSELPKRRINLKAIAKYAQAQGIQVAELSEAEKEQLIKQFEEK